MGVAKWKYKNNGETPIFWGRILWGPGEEKETPNPVPSSTGLDCTQEGTLPDPVLFHEDLIIQPGEMKQVDMDGSRYTHQVALSIFRMRPCVFLYDFIVVKVRSISHVFCKALEFVSRLINVRRELAVKCSVLIYLY